MVLVVLVVVDLDLAFVLADLADDFALFGCLLGVFVATGWRGESSAADEAAADAATEASPPRVRVDRRVAAVLLLMVAADSLVAVASYRYRPKKRNDCDEKLLLWAGYFQLTCFSGFFASKRKSFKGSHRQRTQRRTVLDPFAAFRAHNP